jgi:hypothetical protein
MLVQKGLNIGIWHFLIFCFKMAVTPDIAGVCLLKCVRDRRRQHYAHVVDKQSHVKSVCPYEEIFIHKCTTDQD